MSEPIWPPEPQRVPPPLPAPKRRRWPTRDDLIWAASAAVVRLSFYVFCKTQIVSSVRLGSAGLNAYALVAHGLSFLYADIFFFERAGFDRNGVLALFLFLFCDSFLLFLLARWLWWQVHSKLE